MRQYTVVLLLPDDINATGLETFTAHVDSLNSTQALHDAQRIAAMTHKYPIVNRADYEPMAIFRGHLANLA